MRIRASSASAAAVILFIAVACIFVVAYRTWPTRELRQDERPPAGASESQIEVEEKSNGSAPVDTQAAGKSMVESRAISALPINDKQSASTDAHPIDWDSVRDSFPIPRRMPEGHSNSPYEAGFAREWVERSLRNRTSVFGRESGTPLVDPKPMVLDIVSEPKDPEDSWAHGIEYELRRVLEREFLGKPQPAATRVFCNRHGCLVYLEFEGAQTHKIGAIPNAILSSSWRKGFGIEAENVFVLIGKQAEPRVNWQLFMIHMHPPG